MTVLLTVPRAVRGPTTVSIPSTEVPVGLTSFIALVQRFAWPGTLADTAVVFTLELSLDGGVTWPLGVTNCTIPAGDIGPSKGGAQSATGFGFPLPEPANANRRFRGSVAVLLALDCSVTVEGF